MPPRTVSDRIDDMLRMIDFVRKTEAVEPEVPPDVAKLAVERAFSILSEASRHIPDDLKVTEPETPWRDIAGIGNILRHDYQGINEDVLLNAVSKHFTPLELALLRLKAKASVG